MDSPSTRVLAGRMLAAAATGSSPASGPLLRIVSGPGAGQCLPMAPGDVLGRGRSARIVLRDPGASREHARLEQRGASLEIVDLGSKNGVALNGRPVRGRSRIGRGDRIRIGATVLELSGSADASCGDEPPPTPDGDVICPRPVRVAVGLLLATGAALLASAW